MLRKRLQRIGGSVGIILPSDLVAAADLHEGDEVALTLHGRRVVVEPVAKPSGTDAVADEHAVRDYYRSRSTAERAEDDAWAESSARELGAAYAEGGRPARRARRRGPKKATPA